MISSAGGANLLYSAKTFAGFQDDIGDHCDILVTESYVANLARDCLTDIKKSVSNFLNLSLKYFVTNVGHQH